MEVSDAPVLALVAGLAVARACERFVEPSSVTLKWPNDVRVHRMKTAGILVEGSIREGVFDTAIVGVGLNVHPRPWPPELEGRATCLGEHTITAKLSRATVLEALLEELERAVDAMLTGSRSALMAEVRARCDTLSTFVRVDDTEGVAERLEDDGALAVRRADNTLVLVRSGEVV
jgi:BirA family biotin operon repressor/biotin-[acetyl-CoA-carboxylase] ligase